MSRRIIYSLISGFLLLTACQKNEIDFGSVPEDYFTTIIYVDTVEVKLSTIVNDSFVTSSAESFLMGVVNDPEMGITAATPYFQLGIPTSGSAVPAHAIFDSARMISQLNGYYYGDSTKAKIIRFEELDQEMSFSYNDRLYNTSQFPVKPKPLGIKTISSRPSVDTSFLIPVRDDFGLELFNLVKNKSDIISSEQNFLRFLRGVRFSVSESDSGNILGVKGGAGASYLRIYFHTNTPYPVDSFVDFPSLANGYAFNQIKIDRSKTVLAGNTGNGYNLFPSESTANKGFMQSGTGVLLKVSFPTIENILLTNNLIRLQKAELILRPVPQTYDGDRFMLSPSLYLSRTDATNTQGPAVADSMGTDIQYVSPVVDEIYGIDTYYRFDITGPISTLLTTNDKTGFGLFVQEVGDAGRLQVNRVVFGNRNLNHAGAQLRLTLVKINK